MIFTFSSRALLTLFPYLFFLFRVQKLQSAIALNPWKFESFAGSIYRMVQFTGQLSIAMIILN